VEQVQGIVRIANRYKIPLFTISTGKNFAYGGPSPNLRGCVTLDLKRMNRILEVNEDRNFALVEPGVTYFDLYRYIQERDLKVWIDCPDPGWGSPVGNALDHGVGYTMQAFRDHFSAHCGMEVVLANGEVLRTGMGALPGAGSWQEYKHGFGPDPSGLFGQGNFGIVTKMGFRLMPQPEAYYIGKISVPKRLDLIPMVKALNYLSDSGLIGEPLFGTPMNALRGNADFRAVLAKPGGPTDTEFDRFAADNNLHAWEVELQFYGPERTNLANWEYAKDLFRQRVPGARAYEGKSFRIPVSREQLLVKNEMPYPSSAPYDPAFGVPNLKNWRYLGRAAGSPDGKLTGDAGFYPIIPRQGQEILKFQRIFGDAPPGHLSAHEYRRRNRADGRAHYTRVIFSNRLPDARIPLHLAFRQGTQRTRPSRIAGHGRGGGRARLGDYRSPPVYQDIVASAYSFGEHALRRFHETLKDAVDPNGILSPGRGGVWPALHRKHRRV